MKFSIGFNIVGFISARFGHDSGRLCDSDSSRNISWDSGRLGCNATGHRLSRSVKLLIEVRGIVFFAALARNVGGFYHHNTAKGFGRGLLGLQIRAVNDNHSYWH